MTNNHLPLKNRLILLCCFAFMTTVCPASDSVGGVTVITHGWQPTLGSGFPGWVEEMAQEVTNTAHDRGLTTSRYRVKYTGTLVSGFTREISQVSGLTAAKSDEVIVTVDWADISDNTDLMHGATIRTGEVGLWLAEDLLAPHPEAGIAAPLASRHLHLIGHSRGGSLMLETAKQLGSVGVWVDHLTTLDPHPLASPDFLIMPGSGDPAARLYENVVFADNYWRSDLNPADFNGQSIPGSENVNLGDWNLKGGSLSEHSDVHTWYHGTIGIGPDYPKSDGDVLIPGSWYASSPQRAIGFFFSRIVSGSLHYRSAYSDSSSRSS